MVLFFVFICFQLNGDLNCNVMVYFGELPRFLSVFYLNDGLDSGVAAFGVCCSDCINMRHYLCVWVAISGRALLQNQNRISL